MNKYKHGGEEGVMGFGSRSWWIETLFTANWCICLGWCPVKTLYIRKVTKIKLMRLTFTEYFLHVRAHLEGSTGSQLSLTIVGIKILPILERGRQREGNARWEITELS